jgi:phospholipid/cholesterol/gamma-HCH transport system substrate-binding protein
MILKTGVKIQLLVFALITVLGVSYTAVRYIGIGSGVLDRTYTAYVDLDNSGGAFTNSEVTYRGVTVGKVGPIKLTRDGVHIELVLNKGKKIPRDTIAVVANRSAVGEQYIDLQPRSNNGPFLADGSPYTIPKADTRVPVPTADLLINLDKTVASVDPKNLGTIINELDKAFRGAGPDLQSILDDSRRIIKEANDNYDATANLIDNSKIVLNTQRDKGDAIQSFARNLASLTDSIRDDDPAIRSTIDQTGPAVTETGRLVDDLSPTLPVLLANLSTTGQVITAREDGLRSMLIMFPFVVAGGQTVLPGDGYQHMGLVLNADAPAPCTKGYEKTKVRWPQFTKETPARTDTGCKDPDPNVDVRGARHAPKPKPLIALPPGTLDGAGEPPAASTVSARSDATGVQNNTAYQSYKSKEVFVTGYDPTSGAFTGPDGQRYVMGSTGGEQKLLGEASWEMLLTGPLSR